VNRHTSWYWPVNDNWIDVLQETISLRRAGPTSIVGFYLILLEEKTMNQFSRYIRKTIGTAALLLVSAYSYAVDCPGGSNFYHQSIGTVTPITTTITVAVASNFKDPAAELADDYVVGTSYQVNLCHGSSGTISSSITGGNPYNISLFMSADQSFATAVVTAGKNLGSEFPYANGIPVFLLSPNAYNSNVAADYFLTGQVNGAYAEGLTPKVVLKHASGTPTASTIAVANHTNAPYGIAAGNLLSPMGFWNTGTLLYNAGTNVTTACSSLISGSQWQCEYNNVDLTLQAINNNSVTGGFVGWSQVCDSGTYPSARYVKFSNSSYLTQQYGVLVDIASSAQETVTADLVSYMDLGSGAWDTFLTNHCYQTF
jgi:ABC-type molybdate transport system substrate-binding protein